MRAHTDQSVGRSVGRPVPADLMLSIAAKRLLIYMQNGFIH